jgi:uncharacterized protein (TIGR00297 family)
MRGIKILFLLLILCVGVVYSVSTGKLTIKAALTGVLLALSVYGGAGFTGVAMMAAFFLAGAAATSCKLKWKQHEGLAENEKGTRTVPQVIANAGVPTIAGLLAILFPDKQGLMQLMIAAAFSAATADTLSSELGNVYGRQFYNILSFKKDQRGLNGVISLEGSLWGVAGSMLIAAIYGAGFGWDSKLVGTIGNIFDSIMGAAWERPQYIGNNTVNFFNTAVAAISAWILFQFL